MLKDVAQLEQMVAASLSPDLLSPGWRRRVADTDHPTTGHCYIAAEAAYHALGGKAAGWVPRTASYVDDDGPATHWWVEHSSGLRCDPTAAQYGDSQPPYHLGRGCGFLTRQPSRRAQTILQRIGACDA